MEKNPWGARDLNLIRSAWCPICSVEKTWSIALQNPFIPQYVEYDQKIMEISWKLILEYHPFINLNMLNMIRRSWKLILEYHPFIPQ